MSELIQEGAPAQVMTRDKIREKIFSSESKKGRTQEVSFYGTIIEIRQPMTKDILAINNADPEDAKFMDDNERARQAPFIRMILKYAYVPNTDERVFEEGDIESLLSMPWSTDMTDAMRVMSSLTGVKIEEKVKNSEDPQSSKA